MPAPKYRMADEVYVEITALLKSACSKVGGENFDVDEILRAWVRERNPGWHDVLVRTEAGVMTTEWVRLTIIANLPDTGGAT